MTQLSAMSFYGLRSARSLIVQVRKEMADARTRRSQDPYYRGYRDALKDLDSRIQQAMDGCKGKPCKP